MPKILHISSKITLVYAVAPILYSPFLGRIYSNATDLWPEEIVAFKPKLSNIIFTIGKKLASWSYSLPDMIVTTSNGAARIVTNNYNPKPPV